MKETKCPVCGCSLIIVERREDQHSNGFWNEYRIFDCGLKLHFSPNFMKTSQDKYTECSHDPSVIDRKKKRKACREKLIKYINRLDVDKEFKELLLNEVSYDFRYG
jgi:hypothetical protein